MTHPSTSASPSNTSISNNKIEVTPDPWWELLIQIPVIELVAGLFIVNVALDRYRSPKLSVDKNNSPKIVQMDVAVYKIDEKLIPYHLRQFTVPYNVNRILIRNVSGSAAKNSKGVLRDDDLEYRVCWSVPTERSLATINAHSMEYMDLSAGLIGTQNEHFKKYRDRLTELQNYVNESISEVTLRYILLQGVSEISHIFKTPEDIPVVIAPTENDWQVPPNKNHILLWSLDSDAKLKEYTMIVTSENSHQLEERVSIHKPDDKGRVLQFSEPAKGSAFLPKTWPLFRHR
ncbi:MAG TPA: hypothetical protein VJR67_01040 [Candidatus Nitrosopolaris sp.]|nr:hypothetical protein [Candidatus Nitrosopolaris sp.]